MQDYKSGAMETRFVVLMWDNEPISSGDLVKLCEREPSWKTSTTYTRLRRLCEHGIFQNSDSIIIFLISRQGFAASKAKDLLRKPSTGHFHTLWRQSPPGKTVGKGNR